MSLRPKSERSKRLRLLAHLLACLFLLVVVPPLPPPNPEWPPSELAARGAEILLSPFGRIRLRVDGPQLTLLPREDVAAERSAGAGGGAPPPARARGPGGEVWGWG